jgi:Fe-S oxidoreductase
MLAWEQRTAEQGLPSMLWSVYWNNNPWSQPPSQRSTWSKNLDIPPYNAGLHEVLLYVGCTSSYDRRAQNIARSLVKLLQAAEVSFGYLGDQEPCCGEAVLSVGHRSYFQEIAGNTANVFREQAVRDLVCISPHCYDVFKNRYPPISEGFQPWHYTHYLAQLVEHGRLKFTRPIDQKVTFQDPCYLGRHNDEYVAPRRILSGLPGVELVEMQDSGIHGLCCGGGGGRMWLETAPGERFSDLRVEQAVQTSAQILATACPFCAVCLEDSLKAQNITNMQVFDIAELAEQGITS